MTAKTTIDLERIIGEVAQKHQLLLRRDDPILVAVTLNEAVLGTIWARMQVELAAAQDQIAAGTTQYLAASQALGERLVTEATKHLLAQLREANNGAVGAIKAAVERELLDLRKTSEQASMARQSAWWAAALCLIAAAITATLAVVFPLIDPKPPSCRQAHQLSASQPQ